jgi:hypothetical protein
MSGMHRRRALETGLVLLAVVAALIPFPAAIVERWFSTGLYPRLQRVITPIGNLVPFAWFDVLVVVVVAGTIVATVAAVREARRERRWQLGLTAVAALNALHDGAHATGWSRDEWRDAALVEAFGEAQALIEDSPRVVPGRLKRTLFGPYFRWTGVDGMVNPFGLEVLVNPDLLPWERPFVAAHEWAHLAGFANEAEASFVGWLTCLRGGPAVQYSGWLYVFWEVNGEVGPRDREVLNGALQDGPRRDVAAVIDRLRRGQLPSLRKASWMVYDQYLRANRVEEGIRSYGEVVTLILQTRFDEGYRPVRRSAALPR